jgi:hypothetical protein
MAAEDEIAESVRRRSLEYYDASIKLQAGQAKYARRSVFWMALSVVVLTLASIGSFVLDLLTYWRGGGS